MNQNRIFPLLGPAMVVYLLADAARARSGFHALEWSQAAVAFVVSLTPMIVGRTLEPGLPGVRRVSALGALSGVVLAARLGALSGSLVAKGAVAVAVPAAAAVVLDLALTVPDPQRALARARVVAAVLATLSATLGLLAFAPALEISGTLVLASSPQVARAPFIFGLSALGLACLLRIVRDRLGGTPVALAANAWGLFGIVPSLAIATALEIVTAFRVLAPSHGLVALGVAIAVVVGIYGHVALVDPRRRLEAAATTRDAVAWTFTALVVGVITGVAAPRLPGDSVSVGVASAAVVAAALLVLRLSRPVVRRLIAPFGGRLLDAAAHAIAEVERAADLDAVGEACLPPMRTASGALDAEPVLFFTDPKLAMRIDGAGRAHVRDEEIPEPLRNELVERVGEPIVFSDLDALVVRRPEIRPLHEVLARLGAAVVVPLVLEGNVEGALVVPRGRRTTAFRLEEMDALERLTERLAPRVAAGTALRRAQARVARLSHDRDRAEETAEALEIEVARLRADAEALRAGRGVGTSDEPIVAYAPASRAFEARLAEVAATESPIGLVAEPGLFAERIARRIHAGSARDKAPFVVADCAATAPDDAERALAGVEGDSFHPGWLRLAHGGTLFLADVGALPLPVQRALGEVLATRLVRPVGATSSDPVDVRIVASTRVPYLALTERGAFDPELARWLTHVELEVPPVRARREDVPSLTLLAIARACRIQGRDPVGIAQEAMDRLVSYDFPGNLRELSVVVQRALEATDGTTIEVSAIRLGGAEVEMPAAAGGDEGLAGTLVDIEKRALVRALANANGNKSVAARTLGLKRTTFLDKLRRHGLEDAPRTEGDA